MGEVPLYLQGRWGQTLSLTPREHSMAPCTRRHLPAHTEAPPPPRRTLKLPYA